MGPLLWKDNYNLYWPGDPSKSLIPDYYSSEYNGKSTDSSSEFDSDSDKKDVMSEKDDKDKSVMEEDRQRPRAALDVGPDLSRQTDLQAVKGLPFYHPRRVWLTIKTVLFYGITRDVIGHQSRGLEDVHSRAPVFDNKVEHLWTTAQICTAIIMSIAHGANDVSNAIGPFTTEYETWSSGMALAKSDTPTWIKAVGGLGLGVGFWTFGFHIMRNLGNRITKHSPTRGYSMELAAAITVLLATNLGLPVSTTQCITGAIVGVALTNWDLKSINWKQVGKIFIGWVLTVPCAGLVSGLIMGMAINTPNWAAGFRP